MDKSRLIKFWIWWRWLDSRVGWKWIEYERWKTKEKNKKAKEEIDRYPTSCIIDISATNRSPTWARSPKSKYKEEEKESGEPRSNGWRQWHFRHEFLNDLRIIMSWIFWIFWMYRIYGIYEDMGCMGYMGYMGYMQCMECMEYMDIGK